MSNLIDLATKEIIRAEILEICQQSIPVGADERVIRSILRKNGHELTEGEVLAEIYYLESKGMLLVNRVENKTLNIQRSIALITGKGIDFLDGTYQESGIEAGG